MNDRIERKLARDAHALESLSVSESAADALDARLAHTRQVAAPEVAPRPMWQPMAVAATMVMSVIVGLVILSGSPDDGDNTVAESTVPVPDATQTAPSRSFERLPIETVSDAVSQATPLEDEWVNLRDDLERAREKIESELPVRF